MEINKENFETIVEKVFDRLEIVDNKIERLLNQDACLKGDELLIQVILFIFATEAARENQK